MALALATVQQLRDRLQDQSLDAGAAQQAIDDASALLRAVARQDLDVITTETIDLAGGGRELTLPQRPLVVDVAHPLTVVELADIGSSGVTVTDGLHFRRVGNRLIKAWRSRGSHAGLVPRVSTDYVPAPPGLWAPWVRVTYSHGYADAGAVPAEITGLVLDAATVYASNPTGLRSVALDGEVTLTYAGESLSAPRSLADDLSRRLSRIGVRRGAAFSI